MNTQPKRLGLRQYILLVSLVVVVFTPFFLTFFFFQTSYRTLAVTLTMLVAGSVSLYAGIKQGRLSKRNGMPLPWWKHYFVMMGLFEMSFGGLLLLLIDSLHIRHLLNETLFDVLGIFLLVFLLGFGIYALVLTVRDIAKTSTSYRSP